MCIEGLYQSMSWVDYNLTRRDEALCVTCPDFAVCRGGLSLPYPIEGYYREDPQNLAFRTIEGMLRCSPPIACVGGPSSSCKFGYSGAACKTCAKGMYRFSHYCEACPRAATQGLLLALQAITYTISLGAFMFWEPLARSRVMWSVRACAQATFAISVSSSST